MKEIIFEKLSSSATTPKKATPGSCGFDLYCAYDTTVLAKSRAMVLTDISIKMPKGVYARVAPRSGLALKNGINVGAGVIDPDYRGQIGVLLFNHGDVDFLVKKGDRCAQLIFEKYLHDAVFVEKSISIDETDRGCGGFGSTGISANIHGDTQTQPLNLIIDKNAVID